MNYRSIADLNATLLANMHRLPAPPDLIVGVPRSGLLAANLLALAANLPLTDIDSYVEGRVYGTGSTKQPAGRPRAPGARRRVLVLDDSINSGAAMSEARAKVAAAGSDDEVTFAAVYGSDREHPEADLVFEWVPLPRMFQWNVMHHKFLAQACVDIDGVLCLDPVEEENDDGPAYLAFLREAKPLYGPTRRIGTLVTSRLEKYRAETEAWLAANGIAYDELVMLDLPDKATRQRLGVHGSFKAEHYRKSDAIIFIESEARQAEHIARLSGKPVLCLETHRLVTPELADVISRMRHEPARNGKLALKMLARSVLGQDRYEKLRRRVVPANEHI
jgi:uncharacterized HAD superfamily protein/hypoxanthine phosphoribosyltransferase